MDNEECRLQFEEFAGSDGLGMCLDVAFFSKEANPYTDPDTHLAYRIWLASREALGKTAALMSSDLEKLRAFVQELFTDWPHEFGIDGFDLQDLAEKHGLIEPREVSAPCHPEHCACAEYDDFPQTCYRKTALLTGSTVSPPPSRIGPTEPDDTMVICPVCTSQFRAIPLDVQRVRDELLAVAKRYAAECRLCGGHGVRRRLDLDGTPLDDVSCEQCADVRLAIAHAEGCSDE